MLIGLKRYCKKNQSLKDWGIYVVIAHLSQFEINSQLKIYCKNCFFVVIDGVNVHSVFEKTNKKEPFF